MVRQASASSNARPGRFSDQRNRCCPYSDKRIFLLGIGMLLIGIVGFLIGYRWGESYPADQPYSTLAGYMLLVCPVLGLVGFATAVCNRPLKCKYCKLFNRFPDFFEELSLCELREVVGYAAACARPALAIFERERPDDRRPRAAIDAAQAFAEGAERTRALRDSAWAAQRAAQEARDAGQAAASDAARAALAAAGAAFLHPLAKATQVKHILGSAAHAARAFELAAGDDPAAADGHIAQARTLAPPVVAEVLRRYPAAPPGGGRAGELIRQLDASLR